MERARVAVLFLNVKENNTRLGTSSTGYLARFSMSCQYVIISILKCFGKVLIRGES